MSATAAVLDPAARAAAPPRPRREPTAEPARRPRLRLVASPQRSMRLLALGGVLVVASLFSMVAMHVLLEQGEFQLVQVRTEREAEQRRYETLRLEVAHLVAPERIIEAASELGLVEPDAVRYLEAPEVAARDGGEPTQSTLEQTWSDAKVSLGATG